MATPGGIRQSQGAKNSTETEALARFAVDVHNKKENALLEFVRVVKANEQVVAGTMHHLTVEAIDAGKKKLYEAKVWVKPRVGFKKVQVFKHVGDAETETETPSFTSSDLGVKQGGHAPGWQSVPPHDPQVQDAANHAVKSLQQKSNSLFPYELQEIVHAKAEVIENHAKFNMLLKLKKGDKEEKYNVEVHKNNEGAYNLKQMKGAYNLNRKKGACNLNQNNLNQKKGAYNVNQMKGAYNVNQMKGAYNVNQMKGAYNLNQMKGAYNVTQMKGAYNVTQMKGVYNVTQLLGVNNVNRVYNVCQLLGVNNVNRVYNVTQLLGVDNVNHVYSLNQMKAGAYSLNQMKAGAYSLNQMKAGAYSLNQMKAGAYNLNQMKAEHS